MEGGFTMSPEEMKRLHDHHLAAEERQDLDAIMETFHDDCWHERVPMGVRFRGKEQVLGQYRAFFQTFPDARGIPQCEAFGEDFLLDRQILSATMSGAFLGIPPTGRRVELPFARMVTFKGGLIQGEMAYFDLATLCDQIGIPLDHVRSTIEGLRTAVA
jgi:steroid delta-isomerase-like uncharacterized protein